MAIVTVTEMTAAIRRTLVAHGKLPPENAEKVAIQILNYFGAEQSVLDNVLSADDRDIFYRLEEEGLLSSEVENATVDKGRNWRIHYWLLNISTIRSPERKKAVRARGAAQVYEELPGEQWTREKG